MSEYDRLADRLREAEEYEAESGFAIIAKVEAVKQGQSDIKDALFDKRADIAALWKAAEEDFYSEYERDDTVVALKAAIEALRPLFGEE